MFESKNAPVSPEYFRPRFCPVCGEKLEAAVDHMVCPACRRHHYQNPKPSVGAMIVRDGMLLLVKRGREPFKGWWDIPGGFLNVDEHPEDAIRREVLEETGLRVEPRRLIGLYMDSYQYGEDTHSILNIFYECIAIQGEMRAADDAIDFDWFDLKQLPSNIAFVSARKALMDWQSGKPQG